MKTFYTLFTLNKSNCARGLSATLLVLLTSLTLAQTLPPSGLSGIPMRTWLRNNYYVGQYIPHSYDNARRRMYNYIDNHNNTITGVYSGYIKSWNYGGSGTNPDPINCEHTVPQSFFNSADPMKSDIHHLFPTYKNWNSTRSNYPFGEINDPSTTKWMYLSSSQAATPGNNIDSYSEYCCSQFEPREDHKGNLARAVFYFYTMYPTQAGNIDQLADLDELYQWHLQDPPDAAEIQRNTDIETYQGTRNPYVDYPWVAALAWGFQASPPANLLISEYIEGSGNNKFVEVYNASSETANLDCFELRAYHNGSNTPTYTFPLDSIDSLPSGQTIVLYNPNQSLYGGSGQAALPSNFYAVNSLSYSGDDALELADVCNSRTTDVFGNIGEDPGLSWICGNPNNQTRNQTLRRQCDTIGVTLDPVTGFPTLCQNWESFAQNNIADLGSFSCNTVFDPCNLGGANPIFSQYVEGSGNNKFLEIYNPGCNSLCLDRYVILKYTNGSALPTDTIHLNASQMQLEAGKTMVYYNPSQTLYLSFPVNFFSSSILNFSGDDALMLFNSYTGDTCDIFGRIGEDPGLQWNGTCANATRNQTLTRHQSVCQGIDENPTSGFPGLCLEWVNTASNDTVGLGSHSNNCQNMICGSPRLFLTPEEQSEQTEVLDLIAFPNPASDKVTFLLESSRNLSLKVALYDLQGIEVKEIYRGQVKIGIPRRIVLSTRNFPSGTYLYRVTYAGGEESGKLILQTQ